MRFRSKDGRMLILGYKELLKKVPFLRCHACRYQYKRFCFGSTFTTSTSGQADNLNVLKTSHFKETLLNKHFYPQGEIAEHLHHLFPNPKKVVDDVFAPFVNTEENLLPTVHKETKLNGHLYKAELTFNWPIKTGVYGVHSDGDTALHNAYLRACQLLMCIGIIEVSNSIITIVGISHVLRVLKHLNDEIPCKNTVTKKYHIDYEVLTGQDHLEWSSTIKVFWPVNFTITSTAPCIDLATYKSCLKLFMKLKTLYFLDDYNKLNKHTIHALNKSFGKKYIRPLPSDLSDPDFEIYVDASKTGMGAYLLRKDYQRIYWWSESWIKFDLKCKSDFSEFYALVTAIYTWKHKFGGKKVLCYSDNMAAVCIVNHGSFYLAKSNDPPLSKLSSFLYDVCNQRDITLVADHIPRENNMPADYLSRGNVDAFKKMIPTAFETPKKSKKLRFLNLQNILR